MTRISHRSLKVLRDPGLSQYDRIDILPLTISILSTIISILLLSLLQFFNMSERPHYQFKDPEEYAPGDIIIPEYDIQQRVGELASEIAREYYQKQLLVVGLLTGGAWMATQLFAQLHDEGLTDAQIDFMKVTSYPTGTLATNEPEIVYDIGIDPANRHIVIVDDVCDSGKSLNLVHPLFVRRGAQSVESAVMANKPSCRKLEYNPKYIGYTIKKDIWLQGYGLDTNGIGRGDRNIIKGPYTYPTQVK